ncbi:protein-export chaperone SecB [Sphingomonas piscis]|uniref:Protein-export protein SecB n=1 Tax=Sphingomonas piscis TaxID=2714943 RepID=A0A6G7YLP0_9SPHN|nr:protein-export chaperone SecB [Sphingomonas piscis]QIK77661.1 protein-export chaperone SecB [Sphingomonas piscis]
MADQDPTSNGIGAEGAGDGIQVATLHQYIKDLSVESPSAPQVFQWQSQPAIDVQFQINVEKPVEDVHEVALKIEVAARSDQGTHFLVDLTYAGIFGLRNVPEEAVSAFVLAEAPRLLFPFARQIIAEATQNAGFPPLLLEPIDFGAAYMAQMQALQEQGQADPALSQQPTADSNV